MFKYYSISECPIEYFKDFIDKYSLEHLQDVCRCSKNAPIWSNKYSGTIGYIDKIEYVYNNKLEDYCIKFTYKTSYIIKVKTYQIEKVVFMLILTIIEQE